MKLGAQICTPNGADNPQNQSFVQLRPEDIAPAVHMYGFKDLKNLNEYSNDRLLQIARLGDAALDADNAAEYDAAWGKKQRQIDLDANAQAARFAAARRDALDNGYDQVWGISADRQESIARNGPTWSFVAASAQAARAEREAQAARTLGRRDIPSLVPITAATIEANQGRAQTRQVLSDYADAQVFRPEAIYRTYGGEIRAALGGVALRGVGSTTVPFLTNATGMTAEGMLVNSSVSATGAYLSAKAQGKPDSVVWASTIYGAVSPILSAGFTKKAGDTMAAELTGGFLTGVAGNYISQAVEGKGVNYIDLGIAGMLGAGSSLYTRKISDWAKVGVNSATINSAGVQAAIQISNPVPFVDLAQSVALDGYRNRNKAGK